MKTKTKQPSKPKRKASASWALRELSKIQELYDFARCSPQLRDKLTEAVWKELEK